MGARDNNSAGGAARDRADRHDEDRTAASGDVVTSYTDAQTRAGAVANEQHGTVTIRGHGHDTEEFTS